MPKTSQEYHLLGDEVDSVEELDNVRVGKADRRSWTLHLRSSVGIYIVLLCSVILNAVAIAFYLKGSNSAPKLEDARSRWANLKYEVDTPIYAGTKYGPLVSSQEEMDRHWLALDVSPGLIRISDAEAEAGGLPKSMRFPWGEDAGMYYLGAFHQIHCLKEIHFWMSDTMKGLEPKSPLHHVQHCLDTLLQDAMCHADDLPWYQLPGGEDRKKYAKYQTRKCKNFDQLLEWTKGYNACFQYDNVTDPFGHEVPSEEQDENYRYCPEGSQWIPEMKKYFEEKYKDAPQTIDWEANGIHE